MYSPKQLLTAIAIFTALYVPTLYTVQAINDVGDQSAAAILASADVGGSTPAQHIALTDAQIQSITSLLSSFSVDSATIAKVSNVLRNTSSENPAFGGQTGSSTEASVPATLHVPLATISCGNLDRTLALGSRDVEVNTLQNFLASQGFVPASTTPGFFGSSTEDALKQWQATHGIVSSGDATSTGWGMVGPRTRAAMASFCKPETRPQASSTPITTTTPPTCTLTADKTTVQPGEQVTIIWTSTNATYASSPSGNHSPNGSITVTPTANTVYLKTVYGPGGSAHCQITALVESTSTTPTVAPAVQRVEVMVEPSAGPNLNLASVVASGVSWPFSVAIGSLSDIFVQLGLGQ